MRKGLITCRSTTNDLYKAFPSNAVVSKERFQSRHLDVKYSAI